MCITYTNSCFIYFLEEINSNTASYFLYLDSTQVELHVKINVLHFDLQLFLFA